MLAMFAKSIKEAYKAQSLTMIAVSFPDLKEPEIDLKIIKEFAKNK